MQTVRQHGSPFSDGRSHLRWFDRRKLAPLPAHLHDLGRVVLQDCQLLVVSLKLLDGRLKLLARLALERVEHRERFPARVLLLVAGRLLHARQLRLHAVSQALVFFLGRVAIGLVTARAAAVPACSYSVVAVVRPSVNFRSISAAAASRAFSAAASPSASAAANPLLFPRTLVRQPLQIAQQLELAPRRERLGGLSRHDSQSRSTSLISKLMREIASSASFIRGTIGSR